MIIKNAQLALSTLKSNKMRALLTMLGIIIGVMSIITIVNIGDAMTSSVSSNLSSLGTHNITVSVQEKGQTSSMFFGGPGGGPGGGGGGRGGGSNVSSSTGKEPESSDLISDTMIDDMLAYFPDKIEGVSLSYSGGSGKVQDGERYANVSVTGTNEGYFTANTLTLLSGRLTSEQDVDDRSMTAVVSDKLAENMFGSTDGAVGQQVKLYKTSNIEIYTVIGVYEYEQNGFMGSTVSEQDVSTTMYIPVSTAKIDILEKNYTSITVIGAGEYDVNELTTTLQSYFDGLYSNNETWKLSVSNMSSMLETLTDTLGTISLAIAAIAGISLLVGGIGVMNIMLVSVTERTREIGTRKALGAKNYHIQMQFVTEAVIIALSGGIIGLVLGTIAGAIISNVIGAQFSFSPLVTIGSVLFSMAIGVFFGLYPATKAARLDPIEALRYE